MNKTNVDYFKKSKYLHIIFLHFRKINNMKYFQTEKLPSDKKRILIKNIKTKYFSFRTKKTIIHYVFVKFSLKNFNINEDTLSLNIIGTSKLLRSLIFFYSYYFFNCSCNFEDDKRN